MSMDARDRVIHYKQLVEFFGLCTYYHLFKLVGNIIDDDQGVIEHRISQLLARHILRHLDLEVVISGLEQVRGLERYVVVSSHASYLDWAVLLGYFPSPLRFIAKRELTTMPVIGSYLKLRGILIDRRRGIDAKRAIEQAAGDDLPWPILIFAEGTRTPDGAIHPFRSGGLRILAEAGRTLVPVRISGTFEAYSRHAPYIKTGRTLSLCVGEPVHPGDGDGVDWAVAEVERRVRALPSV